MNIYCTKDYEGVKYFQDEPRYDRELGLFYSHKSGDMIKQDTFGPITNAILSHCQLRMEEKPYPIMTVMRVDLTPQEEYSIWGGEL